MSHTTEQAKALWCPMSRIARSENLARPDGHHDKQVIVAGCNRDALGSAAGFVLNSCKCIADKCAMWRWENDHINLPITVGAEAYRAQIAAQRGYCGLAGVAL